MKWLLRKCIRCGRYTIRNDACSYCGGELVTPHPPRFSPMDKYAEYRYKLKREKGLIPGEQLSTINEKA